MNPELKKRLLKQVPLLLTMVAVFAIVAVSLGASQHTSLITTEIHQLVEEGQSVSFTMTTHTTETLPPENLCTLHTYGKTYQIHFMIANSTEELSPLFDELIFTIRLTGPGFDQTVTTQFNGAEVSEGYVTTVSSVHVYSCSVSVTYSSQDVAGSPRIGLNIWAQG
jgi:hypothetical protein